MRDSCRLVHCLAAVLRMVLLAQYARRQPQTPAVPRWPPFTLGRDLCSNDAQSNLKAFGHNILPLIALQLTSAVTLLPSTCCVQVTLSRESGSDPPQTYLKTFGPDGLPLPGTEGERQVTNYPHPYPQLKDMSREVLRYPRSDGVTLTATLYLPPGYDKERDGPLPCILWAYPREFKSKEAAGGRYRWG